MPGFMDTARKMRAAKKRRSAADVLEDAVSTRARRPKAAPMKKKKKRVVVQPKVTPSQKVRSVSVDNSAQQAAIKRRIAEVMANGTTPDRR